MSKAERRLIAALEAEVLGLRAEVQNARSVLQYGRLGDRDALEVLGEMKAVGDRLHAALADAVEGMEDMLPYVPEYFREKWGHDDYLARAKAALRAPAIDPPPSAVDVTVRLTPAEFHAVLHSHSPFDSKCTGTEDCPAQVHAHGCALDPCGRAGSPLVVDPAGTAVASTREEWAVWYGGPDPYNAAGIESYDDEDHARENLQWYRSDLGTGVAVRTVTRSKWRVVEPAAPQATAEPAEGGVG